MGRGGFGITYLARDHALARLVAVKEYLPQDWGTRQRDGTIGPRSSTSVADYAWGLERFVDEARVLARLNHPGIVSVYRILEAAGTAYMAMEYVEGHSLADELRLPGPLPERRVRKVLEGLAGGLAQVHAAGLLHRDIKPANVMLRAGDGSPVLIDFGAARQQMSRQSRSITAVLTPGYAPIEQYSARGRQGPWTDVYALGAVAYAALSGRMPDDAPARITGDTLPPMERVAAFPVSSALGGAVAAALAMNQTDRPQDMAEWLALLGESDGGGKSPAVPERDAGAEAWSGGEGTSAPPTPGERAVAAASGGPNRRAQRRVWPLAVGGAATVLLGAVAFAVLGRSGESAVDWKLAETALGLGVQDVVLVQRGLLESGYDPGRSDGLTGARMRVALREWQLARGLEPTGYLEAETAEVLRAVGDAERRAAEKERAGEAARRSAEAARRSAVCVAGEEPIFYQFGTLPCTRDSVRVSDEDYLKIGFRVTDENATDRYDSGYWELLRYRDDRVTETLQFWPMWTSVDFVRIRKQQYLADLDADGHLEFAVFPFSPGSAIWGTVNIYSLKDRIEPWGEGRYLFEHDTFVQLYCMRCSKFNPEECERCR